MLDSATVDRLVELLDQMIIDADGNYEVTVDKLRRRSRVKASCRTILRALHARKIFFRPLREKPVLTADDVRERKRFAEKYKAKSAAWWQNRIDLHIDVKHFPVYLHGVARAHAAKEGVRGAYRRKGQGLEAPFVKRGKKCKYNTGARGVMVLAGIGRGKVRVWEYIDGRNWSGEVAASMYKGPLRTAMAKAQPQKRKWIVLEDNDPAGFKCRKGMEAKAAAKISSFNIPKRSPDLNVCDYALWHAVNVRMRRAEARWPAGRRESREQYLARLRRTAMRLPRQWVMENIASMRRRCMDLSEANGGLFEE